MAKNIKRKDFIYQSGIFGSIGLFSNPLNFFNTEMPKLYPRKYFSTEELFWKQMQNQFRPPKDFINFENGYFVQQPLVVQDAFFKSWMHINQHSGFYMRRELENEVIATRKLLSELAGAELDELIITRNTTESLNIVIKGFPWKSGDEIILSHQDYGSMIEAVEDEVIRKNIVSKYVALPLLPKNDEKVVEVYENAITSKTKVILLTHLINLSGQVLPVKAITEMAHKRGVEVILDAAHSFAHTHFSVKELGVDYMGTSLHKWLCGPLGCGLLYVKKEHIKKISPLFGDTSHVAEDISKLNHTGTFPPAILKGIAAAIDFNLAIGFKAKEDRLRNLKNLWVNEVKNHEKIILNTPLQAHQSCGIANVIIKGMTPTELSTKLFDEHKIFTVAIESKEVRGVRITPHLYNTPEECMLLAKALLKIADEVKN